jgi:hypothetical protein
MTRQGPGTGDQGPGAPLTRRDLLRITPLAGLSLALAGCGYSLAGRGSFLPDYMRVIGVPMFGNRTPYSPLEQVLTEKVRIEFQSRRYQVQPADTGVDAVVRGDVTGVGAAPVGFNQTQQASRYRFTITAAVSLSDVRQQKTLWENPALNFSDEYELANAGNVAAGASTFIDQERAAIDRLSSDFARSTVSAILEAF